MEQALDFSSFIDDRTRDFTGRQWVFSEIDRWLADPDGNSFFILTGEPGVGKSAIAARLTQIRELAAFHFCIARQNATIDPYIFAKSISQQLCSIDGFPQSILKSNNILISAEQNIQNNYGTAIGVQINTLVVNAPTGSSAFLNAVLQPLRWLCNDDFQKQIVILVDALDEAVQHIGAETIVDLLANAGDLPRQVRFILTSRSDDNVFRNFEGRQVPYFRLDATRAESLMDIRDYVQVRLSGSAEMRSRISDQHLSDELFVDRLTTTSSGNFLFVIWQMQAIASGDQSFDKLESTPKGLDSVFREFLRVRKTSDENKWKDTYEPLLGALMAARAPLSRELVVMFSGLTLKEVRFGLRDLQQFLAPGFADKGLYTLSHQFIVDFLSSEEMAQEFWVDLRVAHHRIAEYYRKTPIHWGVEDRGDFDEYGFQNLSAHLTFLVQRYQNDHELVKQCKTQLINLAGNFKFIRAKTRLIGPTAVEMEIAGLRNLPLNLWEKLRLGVIEVGFMLGLHISTREADQFSQEISIGNENYLYTNSIQINAPRAKVLHSIYDISKQNLSLLLEPASENPKLEDKDQEIQITFLAYLLPPLINNFVQDSGNPLSANRLIRLLWHKSLLGMLVLKVSLTSLFNYRTQVHQQTVFIPISSFGNTLFKAPVFLRAFLTDFRLEYFLLNLKSWVESLEQPREDVKFYSPNILEIIKPLFRYSIAFLPAILIGVVGDSMMPGNILIGVAIAAYLLLLLSLLLGSKYREASAVEAKIGHRMPRVGGIYALLIGSIVLLLIALFILGWRGWQSWSR